MPSVPWLVWRVSKGGICGWNAYVQLRRRMEMSLGRLSSKEYKWTQMSCSEYYLWRIHLPPSAEPGCVAQFQVRFDSLI